MRKTKLSTIFIASQLTIATVAIAMASNAPQKPQASAPPSAIAAVCPPPNYNPGAFPNLLQNGSFDAAGPSGASTSFTGYAGGGTSAGASWQVWHNTHGTTRTEIVPGGAPGGGARMLHVYTTGAHNGVSQVMGPMNTGPSKMLSSVWVLVKQGQVCMGTGNHGNTPCGDDKSTTINQWELLKACNGVSPANTFIIYAASGNGADFYVDLARSTKVQ